MKISFDFDQTLSLPHVREVAKHAIKQGHDVYITTSRYACSNLPFHNGDLFEIATHLGIDDENIRFTNGQLKNDWLHGFDAHYDDSLPQLEAMKNIKGLILMHVREDLHIQEI